MAKKSQTDWEIFKAEVESFIARTPGMSARRLGKEAVNKTEFVFNMRRGAESLPSTVVRVRDWMRAYDDRESAA